MYYPANCKLWICLLSMLLIFNIVICRQEYNVVLRPKRFAIFPEGASFSVTFSTSYDINPIFTEGFQFDAAYDLPMNSTLESSYLPKPMLMRKRRSDFYSNMESVINSNGINGRACIYRALCEVAPKLNTENTLIDALLNVLFTFPPEQMSELEPNHHQMYKLAGSIGLEGHNCENVFRSCPFSLLSPQTENF